MEETQRLVETLKRVLKSKGITYKKLAVGLALSEASMKRVFAEGTFTLDRLARVCEAAGLTLGQLTRLAENRLPAEAELLTEAQETALADDPKLFSFFHLLMNGHRPDAIARKYDVSGGDKTRMLGQLSKLALLEWKDGDRVRLLVDRNMKWSSRGPLMRLYLRPIQEEFFRSSFEKDREQMRFVLGQLSQPAFAQLRKKVQKLLQEFDELNESDRETAREGTEDMAILIAYRPWSFSKFQVLKGLKERGSSRRSPSRP